MISPVGRRKDQVGQGPLKHASIWDSDIFEKVAIRASDNMYGEGLDDGMPEEKTNLSAGEPTSQTTQDPGVDTDSLQQAMMESNNVSMNAGQLGQPGGSNHQDFGIIAQELSDFIQKSKTLSTTYVLVNQKKDQRSGKWLFEIEPARQPELNVGPAVSKDGPPIATPAQPQQQSMQPAMASAARVQRTGG